MTSPNARPTQQPPIPIIAARAPYEELREETDRAVLAVLASGDYILGKETAQLEAEMAAYLGVEHAVGVSSGTEALLVALQALGVGPGDEVITPVFTFIATATVVARLGARPVLVDIDPETFQMSPEGLARAITPRTRAVIPVHLYGYAAPLGRYLEALAATGREIPLIEDAAQAIGSVVRAGERLAKAGAHGRFGCFSFYPTKNLPACGEAGLITARDAGDAERLRQLRAHGMDAPYRHTLLAGNARLDAIQAAILRIRLRRIDAWNARRREHAALYDRLLAAAGVVERGDVRLPPGPGTNGEVANYHQYTIRAERRDALKGRLQEMGISSGVYYPIPLSLQPVFAHLGHGPGDFPAAEQAAAEVLSLPVHQHLAPGDVERVAGAIADFYRR